MKIYARSSPPKFPRSETSYDFECRKTFRTARLVAVPNASPRISRRLAARRLYEYPIPPRWIVHRRQRFDSTGHECLP